MGVAKQRPLVWTRPAFYPLQERALFGPERSAAIEASTKSGKTVALHAWIAEQMLALGPGRYGWVAPEFSVARDTGWARLKDGLPPELIASEPTLSPLRIQLVNGAELGFFSADNTKAMYSHDIKAWAGDEADKWRDFEDASAAMTSTLTATKGPRRVVGNTTTGSPFHEFCERIDKGALEGWGLFRMNWRDAVAAGVLDESVIAQARRELTARKFRELYENLEVEASGNPFGLAELRDCTMDCPSCGDGKQPLIDWTNPSPHCGPVAAWGVDIASSLDAGDWTVLIGLNEHKRLARLVRFRERGPQVEREIRRICADKPTRIDSTGLGLPMAQRFADEGLWNIEGVTCTDQRKQELMYGLSLAIQSRAVAYPPGALADELLSFRIALKRSASGVVRQVWSAPPGRHDDCVLALALALVALGSAPRTLDGGVYAE